MQSRTPDAVSCPALRRDTPTDVLRKDGVIPQQPSVLIVSHQPTLQHLTKQVCRQARAKTVTATSGPEGLAIAAERGLHGFSLIVIDTAEPGRETLSPPRMAC